MASRRPSESSTRAPTLSEPAKLEGDTMSPKAETQKRSNDDDGDRTLSQAPNVTTPRNPNESDEIVVDWDGPNDPQNPKNWSYKRKWAATVIVSSFTFISPVSSSMIAPASDVLAEQFHITSPVLISMSTSIFVLAYAFGPLFLGPLSEIYGRSRVLQAANLFYLAWNIGCGFAQNTGQLMAFRFLAGLGGSAPLSIGGGVIGDTWAAEERGKAVAIYSLAPLLGPVLGPIAGSWIAQRTTWRWVFWSTSIADGVIQLIGFFALQETFAPVLLERKAKALRKSLASQGDPEKGGSQRRIRTVFEGKTDRDWRSIFKKALIRPFVMMASEPIIQLLGLYMAVVYGLMYLFLVSMATVFTTQYHERPGIAGLNYIALGIGLTGASQANARLMDRIYRWLKDRNDGKGRPEFRLPPILPGAILLPIGLLLSGWCEQYHVHWVVTDIGIALFGGGIILIFQGIQTYIIDAFTLHSASALAAVSFARSLAGFGFPLFAPTMYEHLGYGKGNTILAAVAIAIGCPAPFLFWKYGEKIRSTSKHAR